MAAGCDLALTPSAAQDFTLIIHELATNALKHGGLKIAEGRVQVTGRQDGQRFTVLWEERNGPECAPPKRRGFGHTILNTFANNLAAAVLFDYAGCVPLPAHAATEPRCVGRGIDGSRGRSDQLTSACARFRKLAYLLNQIVCPVRFCEEPSSVRNVPGARSGLA